MAGKCVRQMDDPMVKIPVEQLYKSLLSPKPDIEARVKQLRIVRALDEKRYRDQKTLLPYFVCGIFNPPVRKKENFAYAEYFVLDIDHISSKGWSVAEVRRRVESDSRVLMCFVSPSEDGLKVMFRLAERCHDPNVFSTFYRAFSQAFSVQYDLQQVIDGKTSDVARACFISIDPEVYYNPNAEKIDISSVVPTDNVTEALDLKRSMDEAAMATEKKQKEEKRSEKEPPKSQLDKIRELLDLAKRKVVEETEVSVPKALDDVMDGLRSFLGTNGVAISSVRNIQYAKQIHAVVEGREAEINLYYGKRGFRVVIQARQGTDPEVNELFRDLVEAYVTNGLSV